MKRIKASYYFFKRKFGISTENCSRYCAKGIDDKITSECKYYVSHIGGIDDIEVFCNKE
jgi:hypothetical protein